MPKTLAGVRGNDDCPQFWSTYNRCENDGDDHSLFTLSTDSLSNYSDDASSPIERRVTFATTLVTEERTRPRTPPEEVGELFYSSEQTQRFRQEYRLERKLINELAIDPESFPTGQEELSKLISGSASSSPSSSSLAIRHRISRVVVLHNDKLETFVNPGDGSSCPADDIDSLPSLPTPSQLFSDYQSEEADEAEPTAFFDNDSFWSGSLTWY